MKEMIMKRRKASNRNFSKTAARTHYKNIKPRPQRGGIRL